MTSPLPNQQGTLGPIGGRGFSRQVSKDSVVWQGEVDHIKHNLLSPVIQLSPECHRQHDLPLRTTLVGVDPLERASNLKLFLCYLKFADDLRRNQIQPGPAINQHLRDLEVAICW